MLPFASYDIILRGSEVEIRKALFCITDRIGDQGNVLPELLDRYDYDEVDEDDISVFEEEIEIWQTHDCVWIEDLEDLAIDIATTVPAIYFSIKGHIEDTSDNAGDEMDFRIYYQEGKLFSQTTDWYWYLHMDDFPDYASFCVKVCDLYGNPRYSEEDYEGFRACADEWYVLDGGQGEFSNDVPLRDPVRIKLRCSRQ